MATIAPAYCDTVRRCNNIEDWSEGVISELLYANDLISISERMEGHRNEHREWKEDFERKCLRVSRRNTKMMVSGDIAKNGGTQE